MRRSIDLTASRSSCKANPTSPGMSISLPLTIVSIAFSARFSWLLGMLLSLAIDQASPSLIVPNDEAVVDHRGGGQRVLPAIELLGGSVHPGIFAVLMIF